MVWFFSIVFILAVIVVFWVISIYNTLVAYKNRVSNEFAQIKVQLKRRYDLIPNIINVAKGYMDFEQETFAKVTQLREQAIAALDTNNIPKLNEIEGLLSPMMKGINVRIENYPELKSDAIMRQVHEELVTTENKISFTRQNYNDCVYEYNTYKEQFPANVIVLKMPKFAKDAELLDFEESTAVLNKAPEAKF